MSRLRYNRGQAVAHLRGECDALRRFIDLQGALQIRVRREPSLFNALARAIVYQQLSGKAAATIHGRFEALFENNHPTAAATVDMPVATLSRARGATAAPASSSSARCFARDVMMRPPCSRNASTSPCSIWIGPEPLQTPPMQSVSVVQSSPGFEPPLQMPAWKNKLSPQQIEAILGYFISLMPDEEDEPENV